MRRFELATPRPRWRWFLGLVLCCAGCAAAGPHAKAIKEVDEEKVIAAAEKDSFPSAQTPVK